VHEIMLKWLECGDWGEAFMSVIPKRKGGQLRGYGEGGEVDGEGDADEENDEAEEGEERDEDDEDDVVEEQDAGAEKTE
jgi:tRNA (guanine9-N1)-methyltransferase